MLSINQARRLNTLVTRLLNATSREAATAAIWPPGDPLRKTAELEKEKALRAYHAYIETLKEPQS